MEVGIVLFLCLVFYCKSFLRIDVDEPSSSPQDLENLPAPSDKSCNVLPESVCDYILRDTFTVVLAFWSALQLAWVTMLLFTQMFLISRAQTTWESMRRNIHHPTPTVEMMTSAVTAGSTSLEGAQIAGPGSTTNRDSHHPRHRHEGCFAQWKKLLGLDTFVATASGHATRKRNPFSRGIIRNCKDFWCDPAPYLRRRENGSGMLDGNVVNYTMMYEPPLRTRRRGSGAEEHAGLYHSVNSDDTV